MNINIFSLTGGGGIKVKEEGINAGTHKEGFFGNLHPSKA